MELDGRRFLQKIDPRMGYARVEPGEVFQQPDARYTVHLRQVKRDLGSLVILKFEQFFYNVGIVQIGVIFGQLLSFQALAGFLVQGIKFAEVVGVENLVYQLAPRTTKVLVTAAQPTIRTGIVAVRAGVGIDRRVW